MPQKSRFSQFAWGVLAYNLGVILWGAYVRATGSGAGCAGSWPLCNGQVIPQSHTAHLVIELTHRLSSGLSAVLLAVLLAWALRAYEKGHPVRLGAFLSACFIISEALLGALLVRKGWVAQDASIYRAIADGAHLTNTFILLACLTLTAYWASGGQAIRIRRQGAVAWALAIAVVGTLILGISGAVTALGDTLFPSVSLIQGLRSDISPTAHFLIRLRLFHPLIAMSVGLYVLLIAGLVSHLRPSEDSRRAARWIAGTFVAQVALGFVNVFMLAPISLQLAHLLLADLIWINLILLAAGAMGEGVPHAELTGDAETRGHGDAETRRHGDTGTRGHGDSASPSFSASPSPRVSASFAAGWKAYAALTKPRVISLLLFTTLAAMVIAKGRWPGTVLFLAVAVGGYMAAGAANTINMVIDRDIDGRMRRTSKRPTVTQQIPTSRALAFALILAVGSFAILWGFANLLTAMLALAGLTFYVIVYTLMLKRRTWHNIVIGGAAGAFPPLVGWAAVTGDLSPLAWCLFALIFVWTPVHFWALALLIKDDYAAAGIPMLPCVLGERITVLQIGLYAILTAVISALPLLQRQVGPVYLWAAVVLNGVLLLRSLELYRQPDRPRASRLFHYSMLYLALLFLVMAVDRTMHI